jgi:hypothetical protein
MGSNSVAVVFEVDKTHLQFVIASIAVLHTVLYCLQQITLECSMVGIMLHLTYYFLFIQNFPIFIFDLPIISITSGTSLKHLS